ncbi:hypothetical protein D3C86_899640 [compost metagenome]
MRLLQSRYQVEYFGLCGDVKRRRRFVGDQQLRFAGQRHGDHRALAHAARILESVTIQRLFGIWNFHLPQQLDGLGPRLCLAHF